MVKTDPFFGGRYVIKPALESRFPWLKSQRPSGDYYAVNRGWLKLLEDFFTEVEAALPDGKGFELTTLFEKRGGLRLAYRLGPDVPVVAAARIALARQLAQGRAYHRCEACGEPGQLYTVAGWWIVSCGNHIEGEAAMREAEPFRRIGDCVGSVAGSLKVRYLPEQDRLVRVEQRLGGYVISEDADLLDETVGAIEELAIMEEASRLQREARDDARMPPRWMCTECLTEGVGPWPSFCPTCGQESGWYSPPGDDNRPAKERWDELQSYFKRREDRTDD